MQQDDSVKMQALDEYNHVVEQKAVWMHSKIKSGGMIEVNGWLLSFSNFFADCDIDTDIVLEVVQDVCYAHKLQDHIENELYKWCEKQAKIVIDGGVDHGE